MKCLTPEESLSYLEPSGFAISPMNQCYGAALNYEDADQGKRKRSGARPVIDSSSLPEFLVELNQWLPSNAFRVLWVESYGLCYPSLHDTFLALRAGLGESRSLEECPGHLFEPLPYDLSDQLEISDEQMKEVGQLVGLLSLVVLGGWDAKLVAGGTRDYVEFWEGNILVYAAERARIKSATDLFAKYEMPLKLR